uniref:PH domain-containing protein n=1 Tax=Hyaloperonospora arabidopsidis (strain Emoy2) TaxID=559515 RepID=M4BI75_HYAAE
MASAWHAPRRRPGTSLDPYDPSSPPPLLEEVAALKPSKRASLFSRHWSPRNTSPTLQSQVELEVEAFTEQYEREKRRSLLAFMLGPNSALRTLRSVSDASPPASTTLVQRENAFRLVRHGSDPMLNDAFYATQVQVGNFVKMGWLTKQGHLWKSWKTRFFVLFADGTFAYYKNKGRKKIKGCMQLNDGVVSVQHVDIRVAEKAYAFQIEKGFYKLLCYCCSQFEAEIWVAALRSVRRVAPPCYEMDLTSTEEKAGSNAVARHLNKIFVTDEQIAMRLIEFKDHENDHSYAAIHNFIVELDDAIIDCHHLELYRDPEIILLPGNELVRLIRRHVEDRVFVPLYAEAYASLESCKVKSRRRNVEQNRKVLKQKVQADFGISKDLSVCNWGHAISAINLLECVSLPTHKFEVVLSAGKAIAKSIVKYNDEHFEVSDEVLTAIFRYVVTMSSLSDLPILRVLLKHGYQQHPACQNKANIVRAFLDAAKWVERFEPGDESYQFDSLGLAGSRVSVSISTNDIGIQFTTDGNGRGAIVYSVRKLSQAALSTSIVPGLSLIAINHEPVIGMPFDKIIQQVRTAALPKQLTFMTEFYYYQLLSLDSDMFRYLMCLAGRRGDLDSAVWLQSPSMELNSLCSWEKSRGKQVFGFVPASGKGSPLHAAVHNGQLSMVNYLVSKGADVNLCDYKGRRPLHVVKQSVELALIIESLIDAGADIDATDKHGLTPLMSMCIRASLEGSATLLALGASVHCVAWSSGFSALEFAVESQCTELVNLCLSKGANPNASTLDGSTSLHLAAALSRTDIIIRLLQSGANPYARNRYGQTPAAVLLAPGLDDNGVTRAMCLAALAHDGYHLIERDLPSLQNSDQISALQSSREVDWSLKVSLMNCPGGDVDIDSLDCSPVDHCRTNQAEGCMGSQLPDDMRKITEKNNLVSRSVQSKSVNNMVTGLSDFSFCCCCLGCQKIRKLMMFGAVSPVSFVMTSTSGRRN